jgi:hypothetical protein|tara:strand:+ start:206 stop:487 length:282 start_codon:yes stop_codon:yes gene_type:complete
MTDKEWLSLALSQMHTGQWYGWKKDWTGSERMAYENMIVLDNNITKPTEAEVNAKIVELKQAETKKTTDATSAKTKLKNLGLTDDEIKALTGK